MTTKLYHHRTSGGAEYLTDTFIAWKHNGKSGKEGTFTDETKIVIRLDGQPEIVTDKRADLLDALKELAYQAERNVRNATGTKYELLKSAIEAARAAIQKAEQE